METFQSTSEIRYFKDEKPLVFHLRYWPEIFLRAFYTIWDLTTNCAQIFCHYLFHISCHSTNKLSLNK